MQHRMLVQEKRVLQHRGSEKPGVHLCRVELSIVEGDDAVPDFMKDAIIAP